MKMSANGAPLTTMAFEPFGLSLTQDFTHLYWTSFEGVFSVDKATGSRKTYEASGESRGGLTVDDSSVYWSSEGSLWKATPKCRFAARGGPAWIRAELSSKETP